jgi:hypothetical protein
MAEWLQPLLVTTQSYEAAKCVQINGVYAPLSSRGKPKSSFLFRRYLSYIFSKLYWCDVKPNKTTKPTNKLTIQLYHMALNDMEIEQGMTNE